MARTPTSTVSREKDLQVLAILRGGRYRVEDDGALVDTDWRGTGCAQPVRARISGRGYLLVNLATGGKPRQITALLSRVVALARLGDPGEPLFAVHWDGNAMNNDPGNLRWMDAFEAMQHASSLGALNIAQGSAHKNAKLQEADVRALRAAHQAGKTPTAAQRAAGLQGKVSRTAVRQVLAGRSWAHVEP